MTSHDTNKTHPLLGAQLGQYKILSVLGGGGMGIIFKARQEMVDRDVALKLLPPDLARDEVNVKRLEREAKALARLNHPNIVTTFDLGVTQYSQAYIVMEYVEGVSLKELLSREAFLPAPRALKVFLQIADAMKYANKNGIVHRDLKPHNIMLSDHPSPDFVKVLDFGIARLQQDGQNLTRAGEIIGSPLYMSPEQCMGDSIDQRTDVYSLGVVMYQCLVGNVPFRGETLHATVQMKLNNAIPRFKDMAPELVIPYALEDIVRHCLAVNPLDRFQSMDELKAALDSIAPGFMAPPEVSSTGTVTPPSLGANQGRTFDRSASPDQDWRGGQTGSSNWNNSGTRTERDGANVYGGTRTSRYDEGATIGGRAGQGRTGSRTRAGQDVDGSAEATATFTFTKGTVAIISLIVFLTLCTGLLIGLGVEYFVLRHHQIDGSAPQQNNTAAGSTADSGTRKFPVGSNQSSAEINGDGTATQKNTTEAATGTISGTATADTTSSTSSTGGPTATTTVGTTHTGTASATKKTDTVRSNKAKNKTRTTTRKPRSNSNSGASAHETPVHRTHHYKPRDDTDRWNNFMRRENRHPQEPQSW